MNLTLHAHNWNESYGEFALLSPSFLFGTASNLRDKIRRQDKPQLPIQSIATRHKLVHEGKYFRPVSTLL